VPSREKTSKKPVTIVAVATKPKSSGNKTLASITVDNVPKPTDIHRNNVTQKVPFNTWEKKESDN
jgi:hypothetical protein